MADREGSQDTAEASKRAGDHDLQPNDVKPGDWDLDRVPVDDSTKYRSIRQRYVEGASWEETELFKDYAARLRAGEVIRGLTAC